MKSIICTVVILPEPLEGENFWERSAGGLLLSTDKSIFRAPADRAAHIYFTSDRPIRRGDVRYSISHQDVKPVQEDELMYYKDNVLYRKVEAATDKFLDVPRISRSFVKDLVKHKGNITGVTIEAERTNSKGEVIILAKSNGPIRIAQENYTKSQVANIARDFFNAGYSKAEFDHGFVPIIMHSTTLEEMLIKYGLI